MCAAGDVQSLPEARRRVGAKGVASMAAAKMRAAVIFCQRETRGTLAMLHSAARRASLRSSVHPEMSPSCCLRELAAEPPPSYPPSNADCPCLHCGSSCGAPSGHSSAVIWQTHVVTRSVAAHMALAQQQLKAKGIPFFVNYLAGDGELDECPAARSVECKRSKAHEQGSTCSGLDMLRTELGNASVWCVDPRDHAAVWPTLFRNVRAFASDHRAKFPKPTAIGGIHWAWLLCDAHAMVGAMRNHLFEPPPRDVAASRSSSIPDFLWVFDYDITFVGDIAKFVTAFDDDPSDLLVAKDVGQAVAKRNERGDYTYAQLGVRNYLAEAEVYSALLAPVRYSRRMLAATRALIHEGKLAFCETRGPSLCHHASNRGWCRQGSMLATRPDLFNKNFSCCKSFSERYSRERWAIWESLPEHARPPCQLLHRVKLDERAPGTTAAAGAEANKMRQERHSGKSTGKTQVASASAVSG